jgi:hypothetical protein
MHVLKDLNSHLLDQWWMQNYVSTNLFTCQIAKPYPLPLFYHNCTMFQLAAIINNIPNFSMVDH